MVNLNWIRKAQVRRTLNILHFYCQKYKKKNFIDIVKIFVDNGVEVVSEGVFDARSFITNKKYSKRQNPEKIIELMNEKC
jgi:hypothetical protein